MRKDFLLLQVERHGLLERSTACHWTQNIQLISFYTSYNFLVSEWERERERESSFLVATETTVNGLCIPYLLTPWNRVLLENLTGYQLVKRFPAFYGTRRFITAFKPVPILSQINPVQSAHPTSCISILILSSYLHPGLSSCLFSLRFSYQNPVYTSPLPHTWYLPRPSHSSQFDCLINIWPGI